MAYRDYSEWLEQVPGSIKNNPLWAFETYRKALFLADLAWADGEGLMTDARGRSLLGQLLDSAGSISANIEEGYGRGFGRDYARFLRIALGSAREVRGWYYRVRHLLSDKVVQHRMHLADEIIASLIVSAEQQRRR